MDDETRPALSRRALLASAGGVAGAAAFGAVAPMAQAAEPLPGPNDPTQGPGGSAASAGLPPLIVIPGIHYVTYSQFAFMPNVFANGRTVSSSGSYCNVNNGYLIVPIELESGTQITDLTVGVCNSSGSAVDLIMESYPIASGSGSIVGSVSTPTGAAGAVQVNASSVNLTYSSSNVYDLAIFTLSNGSVRAYSARIGYIPLGFGFVPITPTRVYDSRAGNPPLGVTKGPLSNGTRVINMLNGLALPLSPKGVLANVTVVNTSASGFISLYKNGTAWPGTSSINWFAANEIVANTAYTDVDPVGQAIAKVPANASTDFFIDVVGYYA